MISHKHKFIYIHIPKTAGTSIYRTVQQIYQHPLDLTPQWDYKHNIYKQHATISQLKNLYQIPISDYFKFTVIRNPYERAVSSYFWLRRLLGHSTTFKDFLLVRNGYDKINHFENNKGRKDHFLTQSEFIKINGIITMDFLIKFENLQEDFNNVCRKIGLPKCNLHHINQSKHKHYTEYYDEETKQIVAEKYAEDIEQFGYEFRR